jgi:signal transduction histidine kinase
VDGDARRAPQPGLLLAIALAGIALGVGDFVLRLSSDHGGPEPGLQAALLAWITLSFVCSGLVAWWRRPESRLGPLMMIAGFLTSLSALSLLNEPLLFTVGVGLDLVPFPLFLHVFLAFPTGRLRNTGERLLVGAGYFAAVGLQIVALMLGGFSPDNVLAVTDAPAAAATLFDIQLLAIAAMALAGIAVLVARRRTSGPARRRSLALLIDSFMLALAMIALLGVTAVFAPEWSGSLTVQRVMFFTIGLAPLVFLIALLDERLGRSAVGELMVELHASPSPATLPEALGRALNDPSVRLAYWLPQFGSWADENGRAVRLPAADDGSRVATLIEHDGELTAALIHDPALSDERELLDGVAAAAAIALENGRLHAELQAGLDEVRGSRERVIEAEQQERKRLERNLHDGAQQRLIALRLELARLGTRLDDPESRARLDGAREEIAISLEELRDVARGLHPAVLSGHGLKVALESLAAGSTVPVRLTVGVDGRLDESLEVAAFYVVSEGLANVGKHAQAAGATVDVARLNGQLVVEVVDDGVGGADLDRGFGIRGLADRVEALGGRLQVWTPRGGGTRVRAELPCV